MKTKLALVNVRCRYKQVNAFINLPYINGKAILHQSTIDKLFLKYFGFTPQRGETISY